MEYSKINCQIQPDSEINHEICIAELGSIGYESFLETDQFIEAYIPTIAFSNDSLDNLFPIEYPFFKFSYTSEIIQDQNWNEVWETLYFQPLMISDLCLIRAPFHTDYPKAEYEIIIEPAMAFGTGNHETTALMIEEILNQHLVGKAVLDIGCGTGILSILASMRGAENIVAIDIDNWAIKSTNENAAYNNVLNLDVIQSAAEALPKKEFDIIYANIQRNILLNDMPQYCKVLNHGGELLMSGFYLDDLKLIKEQAEKLGLIFLRFTEKDKWVATVFTSK